jgi:hypothetical protein
LEFLTRRARQRHGQHDARRNKRNFANQLRMKKARAETRR